MDAMVTSISEDQVTVYDDGMAMAMSLMPATIAQEVAVLVTPGIGPNAGSCVCVCVICDPVIFCLIDLSPITCFCHHPRPLPSFTPSVRNPSSPRL